MNGDGELVELRATVAKQKQVISLMQSETNTGLYNIQQVQRAVNYWSMCDINQETITNYLKPAK